MDIAVTNTEIKIRITESENKRFTVNVAFPQYRVTFYIRRINKSEAKVPIAINDIMLEYFGKNTLYPNV